MATVVIAGKPDAHYKGDKMRKVLVLCVLIGCTQSSDFSHQPIFTLPVTPGVEMSVWEYDDTFVEVAHGRPQDLLAPGDVTVRDARPGSVVLQSTEVQAILVLDGLDSVTVHAGSRLCAGDTFGRSRSVRLRAYWGEEVDPSLSDISLVRVKRHHMVTDLSDVRSADPLTSALWLPGRTARSTDINGPQCTFDGKEE